MEKLRRLVSIKKKLVKRAETQKSATLLHRDLSKLHILKQAIIQEARSQNIALYYQSNKNHLKNVRQSDLQDLYDFVTKAEDPTNSLM